MSQVPDSPSAAHDGSLSYPDEELRTTGGAEPNTGPSWKSRLLWGAVGSVIGAVITLAVTTPVQRFVNRVFPESRPNLLVRGRLDYLSKHQRRQLSILRQLPETDLGLLTLYTANDGNVELRDVTFAIACDRPIILHRLPLGLQWVDDKGAPITDLRGHFAYEAYAIFSVELLPLETSFFLHFVIDIAATCKVHCSAGARFYQPSLDGQFDLPDDVFGIRYPDTGEPGDG